MPVFDSHWWSLAPISVLFGVGMLLVFRATSDQQGLRRAKKLLQARLLEMRLYADEPALVWRAQRELIRVNFRYMGLMLRPMAWAAVPTMVLLGQLEGVYGRRALAVGEAAVVTVQMRGRLKPDSPAPKLEPPSGIVVETPAVRVPGEGQISWRVRAAGKASAPLRVVTGDEALEKTIEAGSGLGRVAARRVAWSGSLLLHPGEWPFTSQMVDWIEVEYQPAVIRMLGVELPWLAWFLLLSLTSAWILKGRFGVTF